MENYFNYFTEIEEQFRKCRSEPVLLSPLDWGLVESWKEQGFPLDAVLVGIERSFEKAKSGKRNTQRAPADGALPRRDKATTGTGVRCVRQFTQRQKSAAAKKG